MYSDQRKNTVLDGTFVTLRPVGEGDLERIRTWRNSPEVASFHAERDPISAEKQQRWFRKVCDDPSYYVWVICKKEGESPIGVAHIKDLHAVHRRAEVGLYLGEVEERGGPFGGEAFYLTLTFAFGELALHKIYGHYLHSNEVARRLNAHFGFVEEGLFREEVFYDDAFHDYVRVGVLEPDFRQSAGARFYARRLARSRSETT